MNNKIIRFSIFGSNSRGHGGEKRTAQLTEILNLSGIESDMIPTGSISGSLSVKYVKNACALLFYFMKVLKITGIYFHPGKLYKTIRLVSQFKDVLDVKKNINSSVMLWESTRMEYSFVVPLFRAKGFKIVAMPHNIESLVPGLNSGITNRKPPGWFMEEIRMLRKCDYIFAISREDTIMLKQFGVNANYLPYYPPQNTLKHLLKIRQERGKIMTALSKTKKILLLGSAINTPTKEGMIDRINFFSKVETLSFNLSVAGFGTSQLEEYIHKKDRNRIRLLGELSDLQLADLLIETEVLIVHQTATSGALTRIIEMLIAGIPVLANFESGRSYYLTEGLYIYNNDVQLMNYLETQSFPIPRIPDKPSFEIDLFQQTVLNLN